jgi:hypothetical protein
MSCGISDIGLRILYFLSKRGGSVSLDLFDKVWRRKDPDLDRVIVDLENRDLLVRSRDGRTRVIRLLNKSRATDVLLTHDMIPPPHHRHQTRLYLL